MDEETVVPKGVLRGIDSITAGDTASKKEIERLIKF